MGTTSWVSEPPKSGDPAPWNADHYDVRLVDVIESGGVLLLDELDQPED